MPAARHIEKVNSHLIQSALCLGDMKLLLALELAFSHDERECEVERAHFVSERSSERANNIARTHISFLLTLLKARRQYRMMWFIFKFFVAQKRVRFR
jgi:hypothetical protein